MEQLAREHPEVTFLVIYVRDSHPGEIQVGHRNLTDKCSAVHTLAMEEALRDFHRTVPAPTSGRVAQFIVGDGPCGNRPVHVRGEHSDELSQLIGADPMPFVTINSVDLYCEVSGHGE